MTIVVTVDRSIHEAFVGEGRRRVNLDGTSLINDKNRIGPNIVPCGTPDVTGTKCNDSPSMTTR